jgi:uncharacterized protein
MTRASLCLSLSPIPCVLGLHAQLLEQASKVVVAFIGDRDAAFLAFLDDLKDLLLAAPAGGKTSMGLDPGIRTGVKVAVVDGTGRLLDTATVCPFRPKNDLRGAQAALAGMIRKHGVTLISIGNGTASRETEKRVANLLALLPGPAPKPFPMR